MADTNMIDIKVCLNPNPVLILPGMKTGFAVVVWLLDQAVLELTTPLPQPPAGIKTCAATPAFNGI